MAIFFRYTKAAAGAALAALIASGAANAAVTVYSDQAQDCFRAAKFGDRYGTGVDDCTSALLGMTRADPDLPGTLVNRGVVYIRRGRYSLALPDLDAALALNPRLGDAYVNRGAALIGMRRFAEGIDNINRGLPLGPDEPEKAYYNRAVAEDLLDDEAAAYFDYLKASQLKPDWDPPKQELPRFTVTQK
jgi:tetratricopeptide (TPR) repeat protein